MQRVRIENLHDFVGKEATIMGWVNVRRDHGKLIFLDIRDGSGTVQTVALPSAGEAHEVANRVRSEWVVAATGTVNKRPDKMVNASEPTGDIEIALTKLEVLSEAKELPFDKDGDLNIDTYLDHLPLTLRSDRGQAIFHIQATIVEAYREALRSQHFVEFQSPKLVGEDAEGGANVFRVDYFNDKDAFLATSPQFYKQIMVGAFERAFTTSTVFRAEKHSTTRHLNEYTSIDAEMGFITDHHDIMEVLTRVIRHIRQKLEERNVRELALLGTELPLIPENIPHMKLREAQRIITDKTGEDCTQEPDLEPSHEQFLCEYARQELGSDAIFITHYPVSKRPFYTYEDENDHGFTKSFDLLFRGVEITTGGQRVHQYDELVERIKAKGMDPDKFTFYLQAFKYGMPPHGGWGMGLERLTQKFTGVSNVKLATLFPRDMNRIDSLLSQ
jgi:nondiscriminating aspartyl-tRNA synthetase